MARALVKITSGRAKVARGMLKIKIGRAAVGPALVKIHSGRADARPLLNFTSGHTSARPRLIVTPMPGTPPHDHF